MGKKESGEKKQKSKSTSLPPGQKAPAAGDSFDMNGTADFINNLSTYEVEERFEQMLVRHNCIGPDMEILFM